MEDFSCSRNVSMPIGTMVFLIISVVLWSNESQQAYAFQPSSTSGWQRPMLTTTQHKRISPNLSSGYGFQKYLVVKRSSPSSLRAGKTDDSNDKPIDTAVVDEDVPLAQSKDNDGDTALTNTINERLMTELQEAAGKEKFGARSTAGKKYGLVDGFGRARKTDEEVKAAIAEARDLNGVNPLVALTGGVFALGAAAVLWWATSQLGVWFTTHPPQTDVYFVQRAAQVFRNITMGMISLASGFFGVTGLGIFLLGVRVAYGVMTGELDPTPIKPSASAVAAAKEKQDAVELGKIMDLMMNKRPTRRGSNNNDDMMNP
mmetsp:Transcript_61383/g.150229  ORF Transcript_61383/g.150229 Transcript_61383/m.150229 type:complete len:316 (+) Transcript_61383:86-1033(+)